MKRLVTIVVLLILAVSLSFSKEGMWVPTLLEKYNIEEMQQMGFKLSAKDVYDVNYSSLKDAIVIFGRGCTGEVISDEGLLITNHHCGYRAIQSHSTLEHDYLSNGFWAMNKEEELPNPSLSVRFLEYMEDVTSKVLEGTEEVEGDKKQKKIDKNIKQVVEEVTIEGKLEASVKPLFYGNQYFLYVYKRYTDVRLVGAPPSSIGKFGGDTDNWMWPRHTGDFSLFRIYADKNNEPAPYSEDNVPFKPKKFLPISLKGVQPEDFTMVFGYPGSTTEYLPSNAIDIIMNQRDPDRIKIRGRKIEVMKKDMEDDPLVKIKYAAKYSGVTNAWKKWQGEIKGLSRMKAIEKKKAFEGEFKQWAIENNTWDSTYQQVFDDFNGLYATYGRVVKASDYYNEIFWRGPDIFQMASQVNGYLKKVKKENKLPAGNSLEDLKKELDKLYKDFNRPTDEKIMAVLLPMLVNDLEHKFLPSSTKEKIVKLGSQKLVEKVYRKSALCNKDKLYEILESGKVQKLEKDPMVNFYREFRTHYYIYIDPVLALIEETINSSMKTYVAGLVEMKKGQPFYPDANGTLRISYGKVEGYQPKDGVRYKHKTTLEGVIAKDDPEDYYFDVPEKLKKLHQEKDYGIYSEGNTIPVCFVASNHTSGGNSGSPVLNADGHLIGLNFDRCWEGTMSDVMYDPEVCRNISLDIRYALFIIDKFAGAGYLLGEMKVIK